MANQKKSKPKKTKAEKRSPSDPQTLSEHSRHPPRKKSSSEWNEAHEPVTSELPGLGAMECLKKSVHPGDTATAPLLGETLPPFIDSHYTEHAPTTGPTQQFDTAPN